MYHGMFHSLDPRTPDPAPKTPKVTVDIFHHAFLLLSKWAKVAENE